MGTMTRPFDEVLGLMESAARKILVEEHDHTFTDSFGMSELVTTAGNVTTTFVDELMMVRTHTEDSGTTVVVAVYSIEDEYVVSLDDTDEADEDGKVKYPTDPVGGDPMNLDEKEIWYDSSDPEGSVATIKECLDKGIINVPTDCQCGCHDEH